jgi:phosphate-selective porin
MRAATTRSATLLFAAVALVTSASAGQGGTEPPVTFTPGLRLQGRYVQDQSDGNSDFFIARVRLKGAGQFYGLGKYYTEVKLDNTGRNARTSSAQVENAWLEFPLRPTVNLRVGFYDIPFSRNALTSDGKLLLMDRSLIKDEVTAVGMADNTIGLLAHGRPMAGRFEYSGGVFDNLAFEQAPGPTARTADGVMVSGRVVAHLWDPAPAGGYADYKSSYVGQGRRLAIGANAAHLGTAKEGATPLSVTAMGVDVFFNTGPFTAEGEYDRIKENRDPGGAPDRTAQGWYAQGGYLVTQRIELAGRYQQLDPNTDVSGDRVQWTTLGVNVYLRDHNVKIQGEYTLKGEQGASVNNDLLQVQLQLEF